MQWLSGHLKALIYQNRHFGSRKSLDNIEATKGRWKLSSLNPQQNRVKQTVTMQKGSEALMVCLALGNWISSSSVAVSTSKMIVWDFGNEAAFELWKKGSRILTTLKGNNAAITGHLRGPWLLIIPGQCLWQWRAVKKVNFLVLCQIGLYFNG